MQVETVLAKFHNGVHGYSFSPNGLDVHKGDYVIVETEKGKDIVKIVKDIELVDFIGGTKFNVIPSNAKTVFYTNMKYDEMKTLHKQHET